MNTEVMFSSEKQDWETPWDLFNKLDKEFNFDMDVCATEHNTKCHRFISPEMDAFTCDWNKFNRTCWMNPPYGSEIGRWIEKAFKESQKGATVVCLIPARTDTKYWHEYVMQASEIRFIKGRVKFVGAKNNAPFPSAIVIFRPDKTELKVVAF